MRDGQSLVVVVGMALLLAQRRWIVTESALVEHVEGTTFRKALTSGAVLSDVVRWRGELFVAIAR